MWLKLSVFVILAISLAACTENAVICYYGTWATYRHGDGKFDVGTIDPHLCTHLVYAFAGINNQGEVIALDPYLDLPDSGGRDNFRKFNALKEKNPRLKTVLAVGGWNEGSAKYSIMAASATLRGNFINSTLDMLITYGFDGLDLDWEYPNRRDTVHGQADVDNYTQLLKELSEAFNPRGFILSAAVSSVEDMASLSYDVPAISRYLDTVHVMTYDMAGSWDVMTGHHSPLHRGQAYQDDSVPENWYTVEESLRYWINAGCPPEKIAMGVPFYARTFRLANSNVNGVRAPSNGAGLAGPYTASMGMMGYNELCYKLKTESWTKGYDSLAKASYAVKDFDWVSYDNPESITVKINYAKSLGVNKIMMWSIETDDFHGLCGGGVNPLLKTINNALDINIDDDNTNENDNDNNDNNDNDNDDGNDNDTDDDNDNAHTETTTTKVSTSTESSQEFVCKQEGFAANPRDCTSFYLCTVDSIGGFKPNRFQCPADLYWDQKNLVCEYSHLVECNVN